MCVCVYVCVLLKETFFTEDENTFRKHNTNWDGLVEHNKHLTVLKVYLFCTKCIVGYLIYLYKYYIYMDVHNMYVNTSYKYQPLFLLF